LKRVIIMVFFLICFTNQLFSKETDKSVKPATTIKKEVVYPQQIIWGYEMFNNTGVIYTFDSISVKKIGEYLGFEIYEEEIDGADSKFIKTETGYLHYIKLDGIVKKPNIYLYPLSELKIDVNLDFKGEILFSYPKYNNGWKIIANEKGEIKNIADNKTYSYLFWEGMYKKNWNINEGFVVKGSDTANFLQEKLEYMGLIPKEYNEFIVYWLPLMENNKFNYISFVNEEYSKEIVLNVNPKPDKIIRVFMVFKELETQINVKEPKLVKNERKGFTVVEWGGMKID